MFIFGNVNCEKCPYSYEDTYETKMGKVVKLLCCKKEKGRTISVGDEHVSIPEWCPERNIF